MQHFFDMPSKSAIAAISTPQAAGGIGVIRISGKDARKVAGKVFYSVSGKKLDDIKGYRALYGRVRDEKGDIDEAVALNFREPNSYTGENVVELSCHGGLTVLRRVLRAVFAAGASPAGPGEFTRRAFMNGKISLTQAESVMQLISAKGEAAARSALAGHDGALDKKIKSVKDSLVAAAAHLSAWADYPEEDIPQVNPGNLGNTLLNAEKDLKGLIDMFEAGRAVREGVKTTIAGRPNAGKSTLMNLLSGCERSIVTEYAGTTRDVVENTVMFGGIPLLLSDTAGIRESADPVELIGVNRAYGMIRSSELVLAVFDASQPLGGDDMNLIKEIGKTRCVAVVNKIDLPLKADMDFIKGQFKHTVCMSAVTGEGLKRLEEAVASVLGTDKLEPESCMLFTERQRNAAEKALRFVREAYGALKSGVTLDAVTVSVEGAVDALLELTGEKATQAVVDSVFSHFCVGK
jgi:tRNA modification GTPase